MGALYGLLIIALGSMGQSSSYVPIKKVKTWSWESFWTVQGVFAWIVFPILGALLAIPSLCQLLDIYGANGAAVAKTFGYGVLWGIGGLTFGLSMRYLGVAMGQSVALGTCSVFGTLAPYILEGRTLFDKEGMTLLVGVGIALLGIFAIGIAGSLRDKESKKEAGAKSEFNLAKGLLVALLAGVMSACFNLGLEAGAPLKEASMAAGAKELFVLNPVILIVTLGGFITNLLYCLYQNAKNKTFDDYKKISSSVWISNLAFCGLAGVLWYSQFFGLGMGQSFFEKGSVMMAFSWSILMSLNVLFSNVWGILLKEWKGCSMKTIGTLIAGLLLLILSLIYPNLV